MRSWFVTAWRFATWPTIRSPVFENATTEGVVRLPSALVITTGSPPSITATQELVVPRSIPIILLIVCSSYRNLYYLQNLVSDLHHGKSHDLFADLKALLEDLGDHIFAQALVFNMHHGVMHIGIEGVARFAEFGDAQGAHDLA